MIDSYQANKDLSYALWHYKTRNQTVQDPVQFNLNLGEQKKTSLTSINDLVHVLIKSVVQVTN